MISDPDAANLTRDFFFTGGALSHRTAVLAWQFQSIPPAVNALIRSYFPAGGGPVAPDWAVTDYDSVWTVKLDAAGNLSVDNALCEGIDSARLPAVAPRF